MCYWLFYSVHNCKLCVMIYEEQTKSFPKLYYPFFLLLVTVCFASLGKACIYVKLHRQKESCCKYLLNCGTAKKIRFCQVGRRVEQGWSVLTYFCSSA